MRPRGLSGRAAARRGALLPALAATALLTCAFPPPAAAADPTPQQAIEGAMMCYCGCADLTVRVCTCGTADAIRADIARRLAAGETPEQVLAAYVAQHGEKIRSAPTKSGFNLLAWTMPFIVLFASGAGLILLVRKWQKAGAREVSGAATSTARRGAPGSPGAAAPPDERDRKLFERVRREIEDTR